MAENAKLGYEGGAEGLLALTYPKVITIDRWPWLINTSIPAALDYPIASLGKSWCGGACFLIICIMLFNFLIREFVSGLLAMFYAESWSERSQGLAHLVRASA